MDDSKRIVPYYVEMLPTGGWGAIHVGTRYPSSWGLTEDAALEKLVEDTVRRFPGEQIVMMPYVPKGGR